MSDEAESSYDGTWEMVDGSMSTIRQFRQQVPGGWLVLCVMEESTSMVFLPDPQGEWDPPIKQSRKRGHDFM